MVGTGVRRQRGRGLLRGQGPHVRAEREDRRDRVGILSRAERAFVCRERRWRQCGCETTDGGLVAQVEWNGPAYSPQTDLVYTGAVDWCATVRVADPAKVKSVSVGQPWSGSADEHNLYGTFDPTDRWAGWIYATDAESGATAWKFKAAATILSGVTPTAGGLVFFGDMVGTAHALDAKSGEEIWRLDLGGAAGGGVITYESGGRQLIAFAAGMKIGRASCRERV